MLQVLTLEPWQNMHTTHHIRCAEALLWSAPPSISRGHGISYKLGARLALGHDGASHLWLGHLGAAGRGLQTRQKGVWKDSNTSHTLGIDAYTYM